MPSIALSLVGAGWLIIVFFSYCLAFPPAAVIGFLSLPVFSPGWHLIDPLLNVAVLALFLASARGYGSVFVRHVFKSGLSGASLEHFLFSLPMGFGLISLAVLGGNIMDVTSVWFYGIILAAGCAGNAAAYVPLTAIVNYLRAMSVSSFIFWGVAAIPCGISLVGALAPPTQFDALVYHLELPARYLAHGGIYAVPANIFFSFPQGMEMLFQMAMALRGDVVASLIAWMFYPLTALAVFSFCRRFSPDGGGEILGCVSALIWLYLPHALLLSTGTYVDIALAYYVLMGLFGLFLWRESSDSTMWLMISGMLGGFACGVKYTGIIFAAYAVLVIIVTVPRQKWRSYLLLFSFSAMAVFAPWIIKNIVFLKNPLAPWGAGLFSRSAVTPETAQAYFAHIAGHGMPLSGIRDVLLLPWNMTVHGVSFGGALDILGPVYVLFVPCVLLTGFCLFSKTKISTINRDFLLIVLLFGIAWLFTGKVLRFLLPVLPLASIIAAAGVMAAYRKSTALRITAMAVFVAAIAHNMLMAGMLLSYAEPSGVVLGGESRARYLGRKLNYFRGVAAAAPLLDSRARVLYFGETRGYYFDGDHVTPTYHDRHPLIAAANAVADAGSLGNRLAADGFTHLFVSQHEARRLGMEKQFSAAGLSVWQEFRNSKLRSLYKDAYCELYEINR